METIKEEIKQTAEEILYKHCRGYINYPLRQLIIAAMHEFAQSQPISRDEVGRVEGIKALEEKYKKYIGNLDWHIKTNKPNEVETNRLKQRIGDFREVLHDIQSFLSTYKGLPTVENMLDECEPYLVKGEYYHIPVNELKELITYSQTLK